MGDYSISSYHQGGIIANMLHFFLLPAFALAAPATDPLYSLGVGVAHTHVQPVTSCQTISEVAVQQSCHLETSEVGHTEYDTVVETSHVSECSDVVTQECTQTSTSVFPSTSVVGTSASLHLTKREAEADADAHIGITGYVVSSPAVATVAVAAPTIAIATPAVAVATHSVDEPTCTKATERVCKKVPVETSKKVARKVCEPVSQKVCANVEVAVPRQVCSQTAVAVSTPAIAVATPTVAVVGGLGAGLGLGGAVAIY